MLYLFCGFLELSTGEKIGKKSQYFVVHFVNLHEIFTSSPHTHDAIWVINDTNVLNLMFLQGAFKRVNAHSLIVLICL